jgi:exopolyphosphatase/guanosine-5'-triphosphate,3'-diphosphate pyrophosphatase
MNSAPPQRRAVIDVGTNSVKLLVADVAGSHITPVAEESNQTRLGAGFYATRQLQPAAIAKTAAAAAKYSAKAASMGASSVRIIGTSAARDALNAPALATAIRQESGLPMQILTGEEEAEWVFRGVASDARLARLPVLILDVGGGSTEFIVGENSVPQFCRSYALGTVRLLEQLQPGDPPGLDALARCRAFLREFLDKQVVPALEPALRSISALPACDLPIPSPHEVGRGDGSTQPGQIQDACPAPGQSGGETQLVGTSGTASILARMEARTEGFNREQIESTVLPLARLRALLEEQWQLPLAARRKIPGLPPDRADVILTGMAIYESIMDRFGFTRLHISTRGLRYWALLQPLDCQSQS